MRVLISDKFENVGLTELRERGLTVEYRPGTPADALPALVTEINPDVLVVRSTQVTAATLQSGKKLKLVVRAGAGVDNIDIATASEEGISVANCPGKNAIAVAELTWGLILSCDRRIADQTVDLRAGTWNKKEYSIAKGLYGRTLGVLGFGPIAKAVIERGKAFGMNVAVWSRSLTHNTAEQWDVVAKMSPADVASVSDVLTVHVAATPDTKKLVGSDVFAAMKPESIFVNTTRGSVVDEVALAKAVAEKKLRVGLDVFEGEPKLGNCEFKPSMSDVPWFTGCHHIGASTDQAQIAIALETVRIIDVFGKTGSVEQCVNRAVKSPATCLLTVRHRNRPGVLAKVFAALSEASINVEEMENVIYAGASAACAQIRLSSEPTAQVLQKITQGSEHILSLDSARISK